MQEKIKIPEGHDFPVSLQPLYTRHRKVVPNIQAVVREDVNLPIATVRSRYQLFEHKAVEEHAKSFIEWFGTPTTTDFFTAKSGAKMIGTYTFRFDEILQEVQVGSKVGLRLYAENSYDGKSKVKFRVGGLVLSCLNGMVSSTEIFTCQFKHSKGVEIELPNPKDVYDGWISSIDKWKDLTKTDLTKTEYMDHGQGLMDDKIMPKSFEYTLGNQLKEGNSSAWGLYNDATHYITHTSKAQEVGKIGKLTRVDKWFTNNFISANIH